MADDNGGASTTGEASADAQAAAAVVTEAPVEQQQDIAHAVMAAMDDGERENFVAELTVPTDAVVNVLKNAEVDTTVRQDAAKAAVTSAKPEEQPGIAEAAFRALTDKGQKELIDTLMPQDSGDRMTVFIVGFVLAGVLSLGLATIALIAERSGEGSSGVATAAIAAAISLPSAIIGGLLGAMTPKK